MIKGVIKPQRAPRSEIRRLARDAGWLAAATDDLVEAAWGCRSAFERIMGARHRLRAADIFATAVTGELARLIAKLSGAAERARLDGSVIVTDLSAGPGDLLTAIVDLLGPDASPTCTAAEHDPYLARLVRRRLAVHGLPLVDMDPLMPEITQPPFPQVTAASAAAVPVRLRL